MRTNSVSGARRRRPTWSRAKTTETNLARVHLIARPVWSHRLARRTEISDRGRVARPSWSRSNQLRDGIGLALQVTRTG